MRNKNLKYLKYISHVSNLHELPSLSGVVLSTVSSKGSLREIKSFKDLLPGVTSLELITFQKPFLTRKKTTSSFRSSRKGSPTGAKVTLRGLSACKFFETLLFQALPQNFVINTRLINSDKRSPIKHFSLFNLQYLLFPLVRSFYMFLRNSGKFLVTFHTKGHPTALHLNFIRHLLKIPF